MAQALVEGGACVMLTGRTYTTVKELAQRIDPSRKRVTCWQADLMQPQDLSTLAAAAAEWGCNVVVHAAGVTALGPLSSISGTDMAAVLQPTLQ
eukprot:gene7903-10065_t